MKPVRIVVFAKAPQPGFAKTRLIPALGAQGAAALARRLLAHTLRESLAANLGPVELCVTPSVTDPIWPTLDISDKVQWTVQGDGDLGQRMARVARRAIDAGEPVLLIGTDCPELTATRLENAALALIDFDTTLIPAADGGYALLGLNRFHPFLFEGISWSTESVAYETLCRLGRLGWSLRYYPILHDIDEPDDLKWLPTTLMEQTHA